MRSPSVVATALCALALPALAAALDPAAVRRLGAEGSEEKIAAVRQLVADGDPAAAPVLQALSEGTLALAGERVVRPVEGRTVDAATGEAIEPPPADAAPIDVNNRVRREVETGLAALRLLDPAREVRRAAAEELAGAASPELAPLLGRALARERDPATRALLALAHARASLESPDPAARAAAATDLGASASSAVRALLARHAGEEEPDAAVRRAAAASLAAVDRRLALGEYAGRLFSGISLASILLLAALGLAITYGVMGVINMAHGELLMIGAYATFAVQSVFARRFPGALDWYVAAAIPVAFLAAAVVGMAMERTVIRFLYGRPLETLLATWGLSLVLIQAVRSLFGPQNVAVANPSWMSGGFELMPDVVLPWNRIAIVGFSACVLALVWLFIGRTRLGMFVRAVTQDRVMAGCTGVPTGRVDTLAFGLGAGIAGLGGVALSQIANVGPEMGQAYCVDSFLVVVLGGVGQLAGAVWAALGLGVVTKLLEGWSGAVIAKIAVLVLVVVFIQKRPQGIFALKGRVVEG
jgi:urea transport system permease protein